MPKPCIEYRRKFRRYREEFAAHQSKSVQLNTTGGKAISDVKKKDAASTGKSGQLPQAQIGLSTEKLYMLKP